MRRVLGVGGRLTMRQFAAYIMRCTGVGTRESVHNYADAMDLLGLIEYDRRKGRPGRDRDSQCITILDGGLNDQYAAPMPVPA